MILRLCFALLGAISLSLPSAFANGTFSADIRDLSEQPVADAVISLVQLDTPPPPPPETPFTGVEIAQRGEQYQPYVTVVRTHTRIDFPNKDPIQHHIYSLSRAKPFEKPLYESGTIESVLFDQPGVITLGCNIHDWMIAYVVVLDTPHFVKTTTDGRVVLQNLPAGRYNLNVWHPRLPSPLTREITITSGAEFSDTIQLRLRPDRRLRRAPAGGDGGSY